MEDLVQQLRNLAESGAGLQRAHLPNGAFVAIMGLVPATRNGRVPRFWKGIRCSLVTCAGDIDGGRRDGRGEGRPSLLPQKQPANVGVALVVDRFGRAAWHVAIELFATAALSSVSTAH